MEIQYHCKVYSYSRCKVHYSYGSESQLISKMDLNNNWLKKLWTWKKTTSFTMKDVEIFAHYFHVYFQST